jgi:hypothetical protein
MPQSDDPLCITCKGPKSQHVNSRHPFQSEGEDPRTDFLNTERRRDVPTNPTQSLARLLGVLKDKGILDDADLVKVIGIPSWAEGAQTMGPRT